MAVSASNLKLALTCSVCGEDTGSKQVCQNCGVSLDEVAEAKVESKMTVELILGPIDHNGPGYGGTT